MKEDAMTYTTATSAPEAGTALPHNAKTAATWTLGGRDYDQISFGVSDALAHAAQRLAPRSGERVLDVATGTGWSARNMARMGARTTGVDIAPDLLDAARDLSAHLDPPIEFLEADAEALPFEDRAFDAVISTFGVMFAADHAAAARELARVCRPGGRLALIVWAPEGAVQEFLGIIGKYNPNPPPEPSPLAWGEPDHVTALLGDAFELTFEPGVNDHYLGGVEAAWNWYAAGFGPMKALIGALPPDALAAFKQEIDAYHAAYRVSSGLHVKREYLAILGRRI
jgi:SAM-dependent methyltransferase